MYIRAAISTDLKDIRELYLCAFAEGEREAVAKLAVDMLCEITSPQTISLVAEADEAIVAHISFSPVRFVNDDSLQGYILAPLAVMPEYQKQRIGSRLIESGIQTLSKQGVNVLFVYGDPEYYGKFGFKTGDAENFILQHELQYPSGWQAMILNEFSKAGLSRYIVCVAALDDAELW